MSNKKLTTPEKIEKLDSNIIELDKKISKRPTYLQMLTILIMLIAANTGVQVFIMKSLLNSQAEMTKCLLIAQSETLMAQTELVISEQEENIINKVLARLGLR